MARLFIGLALPALAFAAPAPAAQIEPTIIGYAYACSAKVAMPLPFSELAGHLNVAEDGTRESFFAQVYGMSADADPIAWADAKTLRRLGKSSVSRWSMNWREQGAEVPMAFRAGFIVIDVSTPRKLALENVLVLGRSETGSAPLVTGSRRWPGRKNGAGFLFEISKLFDFPGDSSALGYRLYSAPMPRKWSTSTRGLRAMGPFDLGAPRSVAGPFARLRAELLAKAENYRTACERRPVHYAPESEI
ncbi:MAG TPA: hypothetical protein VIT45_05350 [Allosphingosinicella sp.]